MNYLISIILKCFALYLIIALLIFWITQDFWKSLFWIYYIFKGIDLEDFDEF